LAKAIPACVEVTSETVVIFALVMRPWFAHDLGNRARLVVARETDIAPH
jgi:hypothetical protein